MSIPVLTKTNKTDMLDALVAGGLAGAKVILFINDFAPDEETVLEDLIEPDWAGYAPSAAVTWSTPYEDVDGRMVVAGTSKVFIKGAGDSVSIFGYGLVDTTGLILQFSERFDEPVPLVDEGDGLTVEPIVPYGS